MNSKNIFSNRKKLKGSTKSFIIAFSVFIVLLGICSAILLLYSLDFDLSNLVENTTQPEETTTGPTDEHYTVNGLTGKSNTMFVLLSDDGGVEFLCCSIVDFSKHSFEILQISGETKIDGKNATVDSIYRESSESGLKGILSENYNITVDKYAIFTRNNLKKFLSSYDGFEVNVHESVDVNSENFDVELDAGVQSLSAEKTINYLLYCSGTEREKVLCDIALSMLSTEYADSTDNLFKNFVNLCTTDISVIDFSNFQGTIEVYCKADDKFSPISYSSGE